jgi:hypothetical protein
MHQTANRSREGNVARRATKRALPESKKRRCRNRKEGIPMILARYREAIVGPGLILAMLLTFVFF